MVLSRSVVLTVRSAIISHLTTNILNRVNRNSDLIKGK